MHEVVRSSLIWGRLLRNGKCKGYRFGRAKFSASFRVKSTEIDLITLKRKPQGAPLHVTLLPFSTTLKEGDPINKCFSKTLVSRVLAKRSPIDAFVQSWGRELARLSLFIQDSYADKATTIGQLTPVEARNVLYVFRESNRSSQLFKMAEEFFELLAQHDNVPFEVEKLLQNAEKVSAYATLYAAGIGKFLPELRTLAEEFNFRGLDSVEPVVAKILTLVSEFSRYLDEHTSQNHDAYFFRMLVYVLRYRKLREILAANPVDPKHLHALATDSAAQNWQQDLEQESKVKDLLEEKVWKTHQKTVNLALFIAGPKDMTEVFARLYTELEKAVYSAEERQILEKFLEVFLPLVCDGVVAVDSLSGHRPIPALTVSENAIENYEFSLASPLIASTHLLKGATVIDGDITPAMKKHAAKTRELMSLIEPLLFRGWKVLKLFNEPLLSAASQHLARLGEAADLRSVTLSTREVFVPEKALADYKRDVLGGFAFSDVTRLFLVSTCGPELKELFLNADVSQLDKSEYVQIPDKMDIHKFWPQLKQFKTLLGGPYAKFSGADILKKMDEALESNELGLNEDEAFEFKKLFSNLSRLFTINGGNTEVLDAILVSQSLFAALEAKIKKKPKAKKTLPFELEAEVYEPGPYAQIPDKLFLHEFVPQLEILRYDELQQPFADTDAVSLLELMTRRFQEIQSGKPSATRMTADNVVSFIKLYAKLKKLLAWNGGYTGILDTLIHSQSVFDSFERRKKTTDLSVVKESKLYRQVPDDVHLEEFAPELQRLRDKLGAPFGTCTSEVVLETLDGMAETEFNTDQSVALRQLFRNLKLLFKHNDGQTFVLDNVLLNNEVFERFEKAKGVQYRDSEYVLSLLHNTTPASHFPEGTEASIQRAVSSAFSGDQEQEPELLEASVPTPPRRSEHAEAPREPETGALQGFLEDAKKKQEQQEEVAFRARKAYEWSTSMCQLHRSLEARNFFNPIARYSVPMFPTGTDPNMEYLVLTANGHTILSAANPLGVQRQDMVRVLERLGEVELARFAKHLKKLQRKRWRLIGGGGVDRMLVLERRKPGRVSRAVSRAWSLCATAAVAFLALVGMDIYAGQEEAEPQPQSLWKRLLWNTS